jgi:hypothetical protein
MLATLTMFIVGVVLGFMGGLTWVTWWFAIAAKEAEETE